MSKGTQLGPEAASEDGDYFTAYWAGLQYDNRPSPPPPAPPPNTDSCPACITGQEFGVCSAAINAECCDEPTEDCSSGEPAVCNAGCAAVLVPANQYVFDGYAPHRMLTEKQFCSRVCDRCAGNVKQGFCPMLAWMGQGIR
jgi:hypothetical protein